MANLSCISYKKLERVNTYEVILILLTPISITHLCQKKGSEEEQTRTLKKGFLRSKNRGVQSGTTCQLSF